MALIFFILVVIICIALSFFVLVQNPKGGGLSGSFGGISNQFMGVKQTTDVLEKGTWVFASALSVLCIVSILFFSSTAGTNENKLIKDLPTTTAPASGQQTTPAAPAK